MDILKHTAKKIKKIKRADQILPEVYGTTLIQQYNFICIALSFNVKAEKFKDTRGVFINVNRRTDYKMVKRKRTTGQTMIY